MATFNRIILCGYVGKDPEVRSTYNGIMVASLSLATERFSKNANGEKIKSTDWHRVIFWEKKAEIVQQYVKKGSLLLIEGSLQMRDWTDKEGNVRKMYEVVADSLQLMPSAKNPDIAEAEQKPLKQPETPVPPPQSSVITENPTDDDEIPF